MSPNDLTMSPSSLGPRPAQNSPPSACVTAVHARSDLGQISSPPLPSAMWLDYALRLIPIAPQPASYFPSTTSRLVVQRSGFARTPLIPLPRDERDGQLGNVVVLQWQQQGRRSEIVMRLS